MQKNQDLPVFYPSAEEMRAAQLACCGRCCDQCETPAEYVYRAREVGMSLLLNTAIEEELSEKERQTLRLFWFENRSVGEVAAILGVNPSTVSRTLERAKEKLHRVLRFAVMYQQNSCNPAVVWEALRRAGAIAAARENKGAGFSQRLQALRLAEGLTRDRLAADLRITASRLATLEYAKAEPTLSEIVGIAAFFGVTADYLIA